MKKKILSVFISVFFLAICIGMSVIWQHDEKDSVKDGKDKGNLKQMLSEEARPDEEYLDYYELGDFKTGLPVVFIDTQGQQIGKENKIRAFLGVLQQKEDSKRKVTEQPDTVEAISINMRGASSYRFEKKQYRIKFYKNEESTKGKEIEFLGMNAHSEWVLNGPYLDKTLMRNRLLYGLGGEIFEWAPDTRFCEVFLDGKYQGVYVATEPVTCGETRLNLAKFGLLSGETAYLVKRDRVGTEKNALKTYGKSEGKTVNDLYVAYPSESKITEEQRKWIEQDISRFESALYSDSFADEKNGYVQYIDLDNFVDYFIFNEFAMNRDAGNLSTYIYKDLPGKIKLAIWDYNNALDNYQWYETETDQWQTPDNCWFDRLMQDRAFVDRIQQRYQELRKGVLSDAHIFSMINQYRSELGDATERNFAVWGFTFDIVLYTDDTRELKSYDMAMEQLTSTIDERLEFMDQHINDLYRYCIN